MVKYSNDKSELGIKYKLNIKLDLNFWVIPKMCTIQRAGFLRV